MAVNKSDKSKSNPDPNPSVLCGHCLKKKYGALILKKENLKKLQICKYISDFFLV